MIRKTGWGVCVFLVLSLTPLYLFAETERVESDVSLSVMPDQADAETFRQTLRTLSRSVADSGLNADYLPGMVTVLYGKDLALRGIGTVGEAMALVPGVAITVDSDGNWNTVIRGVAKPVASGHIKYLLNGEPMITVLGTDLIPNLPIEQIEKIEMIRGPASAMYGESAYAGVLNIVTRHNDNDVFAGAGSYDSYLCGGNFYYDTPDTDLRVALNLAFQNTRRGDLDTGTTRQIEDFINDVLETAAPDSPTDGVNDSLALSDITRLYNRADNEKQLVSSFLTVGFKGTTLEGHYLETGQGDFYSTHQTGVSLKQELALSSGIQSTVFLGWQAQGSEEDYTRYYNGSPDNQVYDVHYSSDSIQGGADLTLSGHDSHTVFIDCFLKHSDSITLKRETSSGPDNHRFDGQTLVSLMLQDTFRVTDRCTLTGSVRGDSYSDLGEKVSPRLAAVYRLNRERTSRVTHLIKTQIARAVRPLTFLERYDVGGSTVTEIASPGFETLDSIELGYIVTAPQTTCRVTTFYSEVDSGHLTGESSSAQYSASGVEVEVEQAFFTDILMVSASGSWVLAKDKETGNAPDGSSEWLADAGMVWHVFPQASLALQYGFSSGTMSDGAASGDSHSVDISATLRPFIRGLTLRAGVKNVLEDDVRYPSHLDQDRLMNTNSYIFYPGELQRPERWWWVKVDYAF